MKLLVTGTGRTGTVWLTEALAAAGAPARHEVAFSLARHGDIPWQCEVSWLAAPFLPLDPRRVHVVHLVRDPLATIRSRAAWGSFNTNGGHGIDRRIKGNFALAHAPAIRAGRTPVERAALHYVAWNNMIHDRAPRAELARVEDIDVDTVLRWARIVQPGAKLKTLPADHKNAAPASPPVTWADVEHVPGLVELAEVYGYR